MAYKLITLDNSKKVKAISPVIISASKATDIPAFYGKWLIDKFEKSYLKWINPFSKLPIYVSLDNVRLIVFWSKNPQNFIKHLEYFDKKEINYYFQFTLNDYEKEGFEKYLPSLDKRIKTFKTLSNLIGKDKVIWRFDPLIITSNLSIDELILRVQKIADEIAPYTKKLVFSFVDIKNYKKVSKNMAHIPFIEFDKISMEEVAFKLLNLAKIWGLDIATCGEKINLDKFNISHNKCIDDDLIIRLFSDDKKLMDFMGVKKELTLFGDKFTKTKNLKDYNQRKTCKCIVAKDIGHYNSCVHGCIYCYANLNHESAKQNYIKYKMNHL